MASPIFAHAAQTWALMRSDFEDYLEAAYIAAEEACRGHLVNARGRSRSIDGRSLFTGPEVRAMAYASDELIDWWAQHRRMTVDDFERQWWAEYEAAQELSA